MNLDFFVMAKCTYLLTYLLMDADVFVKRNVENLFSPLVKKVMKTVRIPFINFQSKGF